MATAIFGEFVDPRTGQRLDFQKLILEHLPGKPIDCPCWLSWLASWFLPCVPRCLRFTVRVWLRHPTIWWIKTPQYRTTYDVRYIDPCGREWTVKAPFVFNGLSVPWIFWPICPADHPDALAASLIHDYCCTSPHPCNSKTAAFVFWAAQRANGMYAWGAFRNWLAVRFFGPRFKEGRG